MNSLTDLREVVDVVIGVDTHVHPYSAPTGRRWSMLARVVPLTRARSRRRPRTAPNWWSSPTTTRCCGSGRSKEPAVTAPVRLATSWSQPGSSSS